MPPLSYLVLNIRVVGKKKNTISRILQSPWTHPISNCSKVKLLFLSCVPSPQRVKVLPKVSGSFPLVLFVPSLHRGRAHLCWCSTPDQPSAAAAAAVAAARPDVSRISRALRATPIHSFIKWRECQSVLVHGHAHAHAYVQQLTPNYTTRCKCITSSSAQPGDPMEETKDKKSCFWKDILYCNYFYWNTK